MSLHEYKGGRRLHSHCLNNDIPFYSVLQCLMRMADSYNADKLRNSFPGVWEELQQRYNAPGGLLKGEE